MAGVDPATHAVSFRISLKPVRSVTAWMAGSKPGHD